MPGMLLERAPTGIYTPVGVLFQEKVVSILCPNCDHENSRSFKALHNLSKTLRNIFSPIP